MRLDAYLFSTKKFSSRTKSAEAIEKGFVCVNGKTVLKPSQNVSDNDVIAVCESNEFVSNGGYKLEKALSDFSVDVNGLVFADVGASTGGFTDCLLRRGAKKVFAIDVGESQLSDKLKSDDRVVVIDNFNARNLTANVIGEFVDGVTCDVSFISLTYVLKPICDVLKDDGFAVVLLKPQFECGKKELNKNGIVTSLKARLESALKIKSFAVSVGLTRGDAPVGVSDFVIEITSANGAYDYRNAFAGNPRRITYRPCPETTTGETARLHTMRFVQGSDVSLAVRSASSGRAIDMGGNTEIDLIGYLLKSKPDGMDGQEYLDRRYEWEVDIRLGDRADNGYIALNITINGWTYWFHPTDL